MACGTQPGNQTGNAEYSDSTAVLAGSWGPNQTAQGTVAINNASGNSGVAEEVELRLRTAITAHSITGYEINASVSTNPNNYYVQIIRWNGPLGSFTELNGATVHVSNGDVFKASISGSTITAYLNGVQVLQAVDSTYTGGSPGVGFFLSGATGLNANYGFSDFTATDGTPPNPSPTSSVNLAWNPDSVTSNPATNVAGYKLYVGYSSGVYTQPPTDLGNRTTTTVSNLTSGTTYFFAVTAYNAAGVESPYSNEISYTAP
jgi:hypothetical protein